MRKFFVLWRRELAGCFLSPVSYVTMVIYLAACGFFFGFTVVRSQGQTNPLTLPLFASVLAWSTILITVVSMRLFADEKRNGTLETLLTAPVGDSQVVLGKFFGAWMFVSVAALAGCGAIEVARREAPGIEIIDRGALAAGAFMLVLIAGACVALGLFISVLTRHQVVSAIGAFIAIWMFLLIGSTPFPGGMELEAFSALRHMELAARGIVDLRAIAMYITVAGFFLFASVRVLETRRWT